MGTTAQKLTYLNDTKQLLKESINSLGGNITSQTTFRQYATELDSIYASLPKVSGTGSNIQLTPTKKGRITSQINGDTLQDGTPTPSTPVVIQSVTGLQTISVCGKNLFDSSHLTQSTYICKCKAGETYTLSFNGMKTVSSTDGRIFLRTYNGEFSTTLDRAVDNTYITTTEENNYYTMTLTATIDGFIYMRTATVIGRYSLSNLQLEKGSATTYEAYSGETYDINLGKNLFVGYDNMKSGFIPQSGSYPTDNPSNPNARYQLIELKAGQSITTSGSTTSQGRIRYIDKTTNQVVGSIMSGENAYYISTASYGGAFASGTITAKQDFIIGVLMFNNVLNLQFQIEKGTQATSYSPYFTPIELNKIVNADYISGTPNNWIKNNRTGIEILKGTNSENYVIRNDVSISGYTCFRYASFDYTLIGNNTNGYSNYFGFSGSSNVADKFRLIKSSGYGIQFIISNDIASDVTSLKNWLSTHNVIIEYDLATPTTTPITDTTLINDLNNFYYAMSKNGETNISVDGNLPIILDVSALKGEE